MYMVATALLAMYLSILQRTDIGPLRSGVAPSVRIIGHLLVGTCDLQPGPYGTFLFVLTEDYLGCRRKCY